MLLINTFSIFINLSDKEIVLYIVLYIPVSTVIFLFINTSRQELAPTQPPTQGGWNVKNEYHRFVLRLKKSVYIILLSYLPSCNAQDYVVCVEVNIR